MFHLQSEYIQMIKIRIELLKCVEKNVAAAFFIIEAKKILANIIMIVLDNVKCFSHVY